MTRREEIYIFSIIVCLIFVIFGIPLTLFAGMEYAEKLRAKPFMNEICGARALTDYEIISTDLATRTTFKVECDSTILPIEYTLGVCCAKTNKWGKCLDWERCLE